MQAKRAQPTIESPWTEPANPRPQPRLAEDAVGTIPSPALLLRDELAARLAIGEAALVPEPELWPVGARVVTIVGLSLACWGVVVTAALQVL